MTPKQTNTDNTQGAGTSPAQPIVACESHAWTHTYDAGPWQHCDDCGADHPENPPHPGALALAADHNAGVIKRLQLAKRADAAAQRLVTRYGQAEAERRAYTSAGADAYRAALIAAVQHLAYVKQPQFCHEYSGCDHDHCCYPGDEFCEHDRRAGRSS